MPVCISLLCCSFFSAISSLFSVSSVTILTRCNRSIDDKYHDKRNETWKKVVKFNQLLSMQKEEENMPHKHGTKIQVSQMFENIPVRRKAELQKLQKQKETIIRRLTRIAVINPGVNIVLIDESKQVRLLSKPACSSVLDGLRYLLPRSLLSDLLPLDSLSVSSNSSSSSSFHFFGHLCSLSQSFHSTEFQFLYVNGKYCINE